jgi:hypothetical protein
VVEHLTDVPQSLGEINRVLPKGGIAYITVSPLYFSPNGLHNRSLPDWEHLNPASRYYLASNPSGKDEARHGASLNKHTVSDFLREFGKLPWNFLHFSRYLVRTPIPDFVERDKWSELDLRTREFRLVAQKLG